MKPAILLVDDEKSICSALNRTFKKNNFKVLQANSGEEALSLLETYKVDIVLSDQKMPGMKGTELLSIIKHKYPNISRIILSGHSDKQDLEDAINDASACHFLSKPWDEEKLIKVVTANMPSNVTPLPLPIGRKESNSVRNVSLRNSAMSAMIEESLNQKNTDLANAIDNNHLILKEENYISFNSEKMLCYLTMQWPEFSRFQHNGLINISRESGLEHRLFTWYLLNATNYLENWENNKGLVIDIFYRGLMNDPLFMLLLGKILKKGENVAVKLPFELINNCDINRLLEMCYLNNNPLILDLGKRIIDLKDIAYSPVSYIQLDSSYSSINNHMLTQKRLAMMADAKKSGISTILSKDYDQSQHNYVRDMEFDFF